MHTKMQLNVLPGRAIFSTGGGSGDGTIAPEVSATITKHTLSESSFNIVLQMSRVKALKIIISEFGDVDHPSILIVSAKTSVKSF